MDIIKTKIVFRSFGFWSFLLILLTLSCKQDSIKHPEIQCNKDSISSPFLISVGEAKSALETEVDIILLDISKKNKYNKEHISNAINLWRPDFRSQNNQTISGQMCSQAELEALLSKLGVEKSSKLFVYDHKGSVDALRFTWVLDFYGYHNHKVINGGIACWKKSNYPTTQKSSPLPIPTNFSLPGKTDSSLLATFQDVKKAITDSTTVIVDTRETYEYLGLPFIAENNIHYHKKGASTYGSIPGSIHLNWSEFSDLNDDHRIKCEKDLRYNLNQRGISPDKKIIVYCQSGSRSSHTAFVLRHLLNYPNVKNYDGSWIEWSYENIENKSVSIDQKSDQTVIQQKIKELETILKSKNG